MRILTVLLILYCTTVMSYSGLQIRPVIINSNQKHKVSKLDKLKRKKEFEKKLSIMTVIGTTIPVVEELFSVSSYFDHISTKIKQMFGYDVTNDDYGTILKNIKPTDVWDYSVFFDKIMNNDVLWVHINQDGKYAISMDRTNTDVHYITTIPLHMDSLINKLLEMNIPFDIVTTITDVKVK